MGAQIALSRKTGFVQRRNSSHSGPGTEIRMYVRMRPQSSYCEINWRGVLGLAALAMGSLLGWIAIVEGFRAVLR